MNTLHSSPVPGTVYAIDFGTGRLKPVVTSDRFPVGAVLTYENMKCPRKRYVVTAAEPGIYGQPVTCEDGHRSHCAPSALESRQWRDTGTVLTAPEIAAFLAAASIEGERIKAADAAERAEKAAADTAERARILAAHPYLERLEGTKKTRWALAAANIRKQLARTFPGHKFTVSSESYSMGCCVRIDWTDGPTTKDVQAITDRYQEEDWNGMEDISESRRAVWPAVFGGAKTVIEHRHISPEQMIAVASVSPWHIPADQVNTTYMEIRYPDGTVHELNDNWRRAVREHCAYTRPA